MRKKIKITDFILIVISVLYTLGLNSLFKACGPMESGDYMTCHWANEALIAVSIALVLLSLAHIFVSKNEIKIGISLAVIPVCLISILIPGNFIHLCMMASMRCNSIMKPATIVCNILMMITAIVDILLNRKGN